MTYSKNKFYTIFSWFEILLIAVLAIPIVGLVFFMTDILPDISNFIGIEATLVPLRLKIGGLNEYAGSVIIYTVLLAIPIFGLIFFKGRSKKLHIILIILCLLSALVHFLVSQSLVFL